MRWGDGAACRAVHAVIRRERAKCAGLPSEEREKGPNRAVGEKANQRLCDAQAAGARPAPDVATFTEVTRPSTVEASTYRLRFGEPQVMAVMSAIVGVRPPARRLRQPHPGTARRRLARSALPQSAGHLQPASAQTQRPHRSAIGTAPLPTHTTGQTRRLVHQHLRTAQGPGLAALDPRLPPELVRRSPLAVAWRQFDRALDNFINEAPPPHNPQLGLVVNFTPTKRS